MASVPDFYYDGKGDASFRGGILVGRISNQGDIYPMGPSGPDVPNRTLSGYLPHEQAGIDTATAIEMSRGLARHHAFIDKCRNRDVPLFTMNETGEGFGPQAIVAHARPFFYTCLGIVIFILFCKSYKQSTL